MALKWPEGLDMAGNCWTLFEMGWPHYSFDDWGSIGYENWGIGGFLIGSGTTRSPGLGNIVFN